jgi:hypothetical protein
MSRSIVNLLTSSNIYNPIFIFTISVLFCFVLLFVERYLGIEWDFHPDARTYIESPVDKYKTISFSNLMIGNYFYVLVTFLNNSIGKVILFNILIYSVTNVALANFYYKNASYDQKKIVLFLFLLVIFNPYRLHIATHVLKDTIIIFGMVYFVISKRFSWAYFMISFLVSFRSAIYLFAILGKRNFIIVLSLIISFLLWNKGLNGMLSLFSSEFQFDMTIRDFDKVPNFFEFGTPGVILRIIIWPFFYLTGIFIFFSPSVMFLPIAIGSFFLQIWHLMQYKKFTLYFQIYLAMGVMAFMVSGFTSYIRYTLPLLTILPILIMKRDVLHYEKLRKFKNS